MTATYTDLNELFAALRANAVAGDWTDLPVFGGEEPTDTSGIWSWDEAHLIVGTSASDLRLVSREEFAEERAEARRHRAVA